MVTACSLEHSPAYLLARCYDRSQSLLPTGTTWERGVLTYTYVRSTPIVLTAEPRHWNFFFLSSLDYFN